MTPLRVVIPGGTGQVGTMAARHVTVGAEILSSRIDSTRAVSAAIARVRTPPRIWMNAGTAAIYRHALDRARDEVSGELGFSQPAPGTRKLALRSAMTMSPCTRVVFDVLLRLVRFGLGGAAGAGTQFVSWIHERERFDGAVNLAAPQPLPNAEFLSELRQAWGIRAGLPAAGFRFEFPDWPGAARDLVRRWRAQ